MGGGNGDGQRAAITFRTYCNFVAGLAEAVSDEAALARAQAELPPFAKLNRRPDLPLADLTAQLKRGWLMLEALRRFPLDHPNQIIPGILVVGHILAYYAVHGVATAALVSLGSPVHGDHASFRNDAGSSLIRYLPWPFCLTARHAEGSCDEFCFDGCRNGLDHHRVKGFNQLTRVDADNCELMAAKALATTRRRDLEAKLEQQRQVRRRQGSSSRLSREDKARIAGRLPRTTIFDFLWRMRVRTNYGDPEMLSQEGPGVPPMYLHFADTVHLAVGLCSCLVNLVERRAGPHAVSGIVEPLLA